MEIVSDRLILRSTRKSDLPFLQGLWNDGRVMRSVGFPNGVGYTDDSISAWFDCSASEPCFHHFIVWEKNGSPCGEVHYRVEATWNRAGLDVKFTPEKQGKGFATEALSALISHVFIEEPDVEEVWTEPAAANDAAKRLYTRCGLRAKDRPMDMKPGESYWALERGRWAHPG